MALAERPLIACVAENTDEWFTKAYNLVLSVRRMGGGMAHTPIVVHFVGGVRSRFRTTLEDLGAEVRVVDPYGSRYRFSNKMRMFDLLDEDHFDVLVAIDCDVIMTGDVSDYFHRDAIGIVPAGLDHLTPAQWLDIYALFEMKAPAPDCVMRATGQQTYPYYNTGVMSVPRELGPRMLAGWTDLLKQMTHVHERWPNVLHENQIAFALAAVKHQLPIRELPVSANLAIGVPPVRAFSREVRPPFIVHYHRAIDSNGFIKASRSRRADRGIDLFNRIRANATGIEYEGLERPPLVDRVQRSAATKSWYGAGPLKRLRKSAVGVAVKRVAAGTTRRTGA
jgi:hypothetical protein